MPIAVAVVLAYLAGSIPSAFIAGRMYGVDMRRQGSGNLGATNVMRVLGTKVGLLVFAVDMAKGAIPALYFPRWVTGVPMAEWASERAIILGLVFGVVAMAGHVRPVFLKFGKGGKGVATAAGVFMALAPMETVLTLVVFATVVLASGFVSLGSLVSAAVLPSLLLITRGGNAVIAWVAVVVGAFVFWTHRSNVGRLRRGEEHRFGKRGASQGNAVSAGAIAVAIMAAVLVAVRFS